MKKIILINGAKRSGKNFVAESAMLQEENSKEISIAFPLKAIIAKTFNITLDELEKYKDDTENYGIEIKNYTESEIISKLNFRTILQVFGTDAMMENFGTDIWSKKAATDIHESSKDWNFITDFRYPAEYKIMKELADNYGYEVITINVFNDDLVSLDGSELHISEQALNGFKFDYTINNTGKPNLKNIIKNIVTNIKSKELF